MRRRNKKLLIIAGAVLILGVAFTFGFQWVTMNTGGGGNQYVVAQDPGATHVYNSHAEPSSGIVYMSKSVSESYFNRVWDMRVERNMSGPAGETGMGSASRVQSHANANDSVTAPDTVEQRVRNLKVDNYCNNYQTMSFNITIEPESVAVDGTAQYPPEFAVVSQMLNKSQTHPKYDDIILQPEPDNERSVTLGIGTYFVDDPDTRVVEAYVTIDSCHLR